jgi:hypothetical protein
MADGPDVNPTLRRAPKPHPYFTSYNRIPPEVVELQVQEIVVDSFGQEPTQMLI